jgi:hypothetical protein
VGKTSGVGVGNFVLVLSETVLVLVIERELPRTNYDLGFG